MGSINFDIAAILLSVFNLFLFYSRRRLDIPQTAFFLLLLYISLGATVMDVITVVTYERVTEYPRWLIVGVNTLYYREPLKTSYYMTSSFQLLKNYHL